MKNKLKILLSSLLSAVLFATSAAAHEPIAVRINGEPSDIGAKLIESTTYVPFAKANEVLSFNTASVHGTPEYMRATRGELNISASLGSCYIEASGRCIGGNDTRLVDGELYVPIRSIAKAYDASVEWQADTRSVDIGATPGSAILPGELFYDKDELYWLSRIIHAEANCEPFEGQILVGNVILNRLKSEQFPSTIYDVIFDRNWGVQFTPTANGTIYNTPSEQSIAAAKLCLDSYSISDTALYFLNPTLAENFWVPNNRPFLFKVGGHEFYS